MSGREPELGENCRVAGEDPAWYAHYYDRGIRMRKTGFHDPWAWTELALNGHIDDIDYDEDGEIENIWISLYNGGYKCYERTDFIRYDNHMWIVA